ncbi:MAG: hypothetical protein DMD36_17935 [Gemmatimonadetes bacterium]|nr:MAG: hypothetical protein DMD36_17935 [Gemmatimonadota bacterium]
MFVLSTVGSLGTAAAPSSAPTIVVPYGASEYKYQVVPVDDGIGFERPDFDDSAFAVGDAGFGSREGYCELNNPGDVRTEWPVETDLLVRKTLELPAGTTDVVVYVTVDNDVQVFVNGHDVSDGLQIHEGCPSLDSFSFAVPDSLLQVGTNLLAVRARDRGGLTYLDLEVTRRNRLRLG